MMEIVSQPHRSRLVEWAKEKPDVLVLSADLTGSVEVDLFREHFPSRFLSMGMAEQNMLSFAGGLAREGFQPFVHTFSVFMYRRALDQLALSIAYPNLRVRLMGFLPGITTPGGATHQAIDDIGVLRNIPNLTILECADATEVESCLDVAYRVNGPVYVRMVRGEVPRLFPVSEPMSLSTPRILSADGEVLILSAGITTEETIRATTALRAKGIPVAHFHISTHKPFFHEGLLIALRAAKGVISIENHTISGGLGTSIAELMADHGVQRKLIRLGLHDTFSHGASRGYLMKEHRIDALSLICAFEQLSGVRTGITEAELAAVRFEAVHSAAKVEAL